MARSSPTFPKIDEIWFGSLLGIRAVLDSTEPLLFPHSSQDAQQMARRARYSPPVSRFWRFRASARYWLWRPKRRRVNDARFRCAFEAMSWRFWGGVASALASRKLASASLRVRIGRGPGSVAVLYPRNCSVTLRHCRARRQLGSSASCSPAVYGFRSKALPQRETDKLSPEPPKCRARPWGRAPRWLAWCDPSAGNSTNDNHCA